MSLLTHAVAKKKPPPPPAVIPDGPVKPAPAAAVTASTSSVDPSAKPPAKPPAAARSPPKTATADAADGKQNKKAGAAAPVGRGKRLRRRVARFFAIFTHGVSLRAALDGTEKVVLDRQHKVDELVLWSNHHHLGTRRATWAEDELIPSIGNLYGHYQVHRRAADIRWAPEAEARPPARFRVRVVIHLRVARC